MDLDQRLQATERQVMRLAKMAFLPTVMKSASISRRKIGQGDGLANTKCLMLIKTTNGSAMTMKRAFASNWTI